MDIGRDSGKLSGVRVVRLGRGLGGLNDAMRAMHGGVPRNVTDGAATRGGVVKGAGPVCGRAWDAAVRVGVAGGQVVMAIDAPCAGAAAVDAVCTKRKGEGVPTLAVRRTPALAACGDTRGASDGVEGKEVEVMIGHGVCDGEEGKEVEATVRGSCGDTSDGAEGKEVEATGPGASGDRCGARGGVGGREVEASAETCKLCVGVSGTGEKTKFETRLANCACTRDSDDRGISWKEAPASSVIGNASGKDSSGEVSDSIPALENAPAAY